VRDCRRTHVLLPAWCVPRRGHGVEVPRRGLGRRGEGCEGVAEIAAGRLGRHRYLRDVRREVPDGVAQLVVELLAKDPEARPSGAVEVQERLQPFLPADSTAADRIDPHDPTYPYRRPLAPPPAPPLMARSAVTISKPLADVRRQALDLAEDGRFTQAAELLSRRRRGAAEPPAEVLNARLQVANTLLLGGEYRQALPEFEAVASMLIERDGPDDVEVLRCRELNDVLERWNRLGNGGSEVLDLRRQVALLLASSGDLAGAGTALQEPRRDKCTHGFRSSPRGVREITTRARKVSHPSRIIPEVRGSGVTSVGERPSARSTAGTPRPATGGEGRSGGGPSSRSDERVAAAVLRVTSALPMNIAGNTGPPGMRGAGWVAFDRGVRMAASHGRPAAVGRWTEARDAILPPDPGQGLEPAAAGV
jgi:hypothetical protein